MNQRTLRRDLAALVRDVRAQIQPEYRAYDDSDTPSILLTVGADRHGWSYQTGDNSFTGGAYGYSAWGVVAVYRDTNSFEAADHLIDELHEAGAFEAEAV
jgi:hypothetical protein